MGDQQLPVGWKRVQSKSHPNKTYFYHERRRISLWKLEDLEKFEKNEIPARKVMQIKEKSSHRTTSGRGLSSQSKTITKKNLAQERMTKLKATLIADATAETSNKKNTANTQEAAATSHNLGKKNVANDRMIKLRKSLKLENEDETTKKGSLKSKKDSSPTKKVQKPVADEPMEVESIETHDDSYELMDWEVIPEQEIINEVHKIREADVQEKSSGSDRAISKQKNEIPDNQLIIIVDTNVFLGNLEYLKEIKGKYFKDIGRAVVFMPYIVLRELDKLKTSLENVAKLARRAINWIDVCFSKKDEFLIGQSGIDSVSVRQFIPIESGDDEILNCCLQIQETTKTIILLSNDKNLRNKAFVNKIESYSKDMLNCVDFNKNNEIRFES